MITITTEKELNQIVDKYKTVFEINGVKYNYLDSQDIIIKAINSESYTIKKYLKREVTVERDLIIPKLEDVLQEMMSYYYDIPEEADIEFESKMKELLNKYNIKKYLTKEEYDFVEEYDIKPLVKSILEDKISRVKGDKLLKFYKEKLERMCSITKPIKDKKIIIPKQILRGSYVIEEDGKDKEFAIPQHILYYIRDILNDEDFEITSIEIKEHVWYITSNGVKMSI